MGIGNIHLCMKIMKVIGCLLEMCHGSKHLYPSMDMIPLSTFVIIPFSYHHLLSRMFPSCSMFVSTVKRLRVLKSSELSSFSRKFYSVRMMKILQSLSRIENDSTPSLAGGGKQRKHEALEASNK